MDRCRGFEICSGYEGKAVLPFRGTKGSAGYDFSITDDICIEAHSYSGIIKTGIKAYMQPTEVLKLYPRSSLYKNFQVVFVNSVGIIDSDYYNNPDNDGNIGIMLYNLSDRAVTIPSGTRVAQGIFETYLIADNDTTESTRTGGIGSTGHK